MDMNNVNIEEIVKQVLSGMTGNAPAAASAPAASTGIPKTARVAVLTEKEHFDIKEYPIPPIGDDDILVKVEGCGVCGTDAHEFKRDPFGLIPVALGHEGTGEIVAGEGANIALVNEKEMLEMDELVRKIEFVELAASADFQDHFIDELGFETGE